MTKVGSFGASEYITLARKLGFFGRGGYLGVLGYFGYYLGVLEYKLLTSFIK